MGHAFEDAFEAHPEHAHPVGGGLVFRSDKPIGEIAFAAERASLRGAAPPQQIQNRQLGAAAIRQRDAAVMRGRNLLAAAHETNLRTMNAGAVGAAQDDGDDEGMEARLGVDFFDHLRVAGQQRPFHGTAHGKLTAAACTAGVRVQFGAGIGPLAGHRLAEEKIIPRPGPHLVRQRVPNTGHTALAHRGEAGHQAGGHQQGEQQDYPMEGGVG
jgi:hypothetical protein